MSYLLGYRPPKSAAPRPCLAICSLTHLDVFGTRGRSRLPGAKSARQARPSGRGETWFLRIQARVGGKNAKLGGLAPSDGSMVDRVINGTPNLMLKGDSNMRQRFVIASTMA